ncbi:MAG: GIY-YIG nuclease family protein [Chloroflexia bacterium]|nr:GIY-YIG nuclease family protein [Chloroflexia bacterium]
MEQLEPEVVDGTIAATANEAEGRVAPYAALCERAAAFVLASGGAVHEDRLIGHVFGNAGSLAMWRPLLRNVLGEDERLTFRADGHWVLAHDEAEPGPLSGLLLDDFVVIDVETTGLRPTRQRVIEVALVRFRGGTEVDRFESLVNPDTRIPNFIVGLTGITDTHVVDAPRFENIATQVVEFIGHGLLVGHNISFDANFLNAELKRCDRLPLINERLDTMGLAVRLLRQVRKPSLDRVAVAVGLTPRKIHRAGVDAALTGEVALRLVEEARRQGVTTLDALKVASSVVERRPREGVGRGRAVLDRSLLADIPKRPGCYLMRDQFDRVIYVGKAKNLRDRVSSYYSQPLGYTRKMDGLLESMVRIDVEVVGTEIEALLLESQLIRRHQPRYNTAMRSFEHYPYIRVDLSNPWPRVTIAKARKHDGAKYFGPYRSAHGARRTVDVINSIVPLRTCTRSFKDARSYGRPCLQLDLGRCLGPCVGRADRDVYATLAREVVAFLDGRDDALYERLWAGLENAADRLDYERAAKLRRDLQSVLGIVQYQKRLREATEQHTLLVVLPSADVESREVLFVIGGRMWAQLRVRRAHDLECAVTRDHNDGGDHLLHQHPTGVTPPTSDLAIADVTGPIGDLAQRLARAWRRHAAATLTPIDHNGVDEANILNRWLLRQCGHPALIECPANGDSEPEWPALALRALSLNDTDLIFADAYRGEETLDDDAEPRETGEVVAAVL